MYSADKILHTRTGIQSLDRATAVRPGIRRLDQYAPNESQHYLRLLFNFQFYTVKVYTTIVYVKP